MEFQDELKRMHELRVLMDAATKGASPTDLQLLSEMNRLLALMPPMEPLLQNDADALKWRGETTALLKLWDAVRGLQAEHAFQHLANPGHLFNPAAEYGCVHALLHEARRSLELKADPERAIAIPPGGVFDYFEAIKDKLKLAKKDVLVIDRFLNDEFVSRFFPFITRGVTIRLLARDRVKELRPAVDAWCRQHGSPVEVRVSDNFHDRHIIIDGSICVSSGASFKDGGVHPSVVVEIVDNKDVLIASYENIWSNGTKVL